MKQLVICAVVSAVAIVGLTQESQARGRARGGCGGGSSYASCCDVAPTPCGAPCAPAQVQYVAQKVMTYRPVMLEKEIEVPVVRCLTKAEKFTYQVNVPVMNQVMQKQTFYVSQTSEVPFEYTVMVPSTVAKKVSVTRYQMTYETVVQKVTVCNMVPTQCVDSCGRCYTTCQPVTSVVDVPRTICKSVPVVEEVTVNEVIYTPTKKTGTRTVCNMVPQVREVPVTVCSFKVETREAVRHVAYTVTETVKQKVQYCQMQAVETTVQVPVYTPTVSCGYSYGGFGGGYGGFGGGCCR
jgi:hypothetical protein